MSFDVTHTDRECDRCLKTFDKRLLRHVPFLYKDLGDKIHMDYRSAHANLKGYKHYRVCKKCMAELKRSRPDG